MQITKETSQKHPVPFSIKRFVAVKFHKVSSSSFSGWAVFYQKTLRFFLPKLAYPLLKPTSCQECISNTSKLSYSCFDCNRLSATFGRKLSLNKGGGSRIQEISQPSKGSKKRRSVYIASKIQSLFDAQYSSLLLDLCKAITLASKRFMTYRFNLFTITTTNKRKKPMSTQACFGVEKEFPIWLSKQRCDSNARRLVGSPKAIRITRQEEKTTWGTIIYRFQKKWKKTSHRIASYPKKVFLASQSKPPQKKGGFE